MQPTWFWMQQKELEDLFDDKTCNEVVNYFYRVNLGLLFIVANNLNKNRQIKIDKGKCIIFHFSFQNHIRS